MLAYMTEVHSFKNFHHVPISQLIYPFLVNGILKIYFFRILKKYEFFNVIKIKCQTQLASAFYSPLYFS